MNHPHEIFEEYQSAAVRKTGRPVCKTLLLALLAGAYIAFGAAAATAASASLSGTVAALVKGAVFPVGLILVVICGAELFTGNCLLISPTVGGVIRPRTLFINWGIVYLGNLIGGALVAALVVCSHVQGDAVAQACAAAATAKSNMTFADALLRGVLCNMLVCLAVWASMASEKTSGKILALYFPVLTFVVCGFEHSVANAYYLVAGLLTDALYGLSYAGQGLTAGNALVHCLIPSTLGNILGGCAIALAYHAVYRSQRHR